MARPPSDEERKWLEDIAELEEFGVAGAEWPDVPPPPPLDEQGKAEKGAYGIWALEAVIVLVQRDRLLSLKFGKEVSAQNTTLTLLQGHLQILKTLRRNR